MSDWSSGYNVDIGYTYGSYKELAPSWINYVATLRGITAPSGIKLRYLELGCGFGFGLILLAALHPEYEFLGIDFNPVHIAHGRKLAAEAGITNIRLEEADFLELAEDWPVTWGQFDYVAAHGIYTWLDSPVRDALVKTIKHATSPGSLVYLSYNTMPGWVSAQPVQHLLRLWQRTERMGSVTAIREGAKRLKGLTEAKSAVTMALPKMQRRVEAMDKKDPNYLVHEYLNGGWKPIWFDEMVDALGVAKLDYVGTASIGDLVVDQIFPPTWKEILSQYDDPIIRQVMIDVLVNQNFRKDVFARGATKLWALEKQKKLLEMTFIFVFKPENDIFKFNLSTGEVAGQSEIYNSYVEALSTGHKTIRELIAATGRSLIETIEAMTMLMHEGYVVLYQPISNKKGARALNRVIIENAAYGAPYSFLVSPETGGIFGTTDVNLIMAYELLKDNRINEPRKLGEILVTRLTALGKSLVRDGKRLPTQEETLQHATTLAEVFLARTWGDWKKSGVI